MKKNFQSHLSKPFGRSTRNNFLFTGGMNKNPTWRSAGGGIPGGADGGHGPGLTVLHAGDGASHGGGRHHGTLTTRGRTQSGRCRGRAATVARPHGLLEGRVILKVLEWETIFSGTLLDNDAIFQKA